MKRIFKPVTIHHPPHTPLACKELLQTLVCGSSLFLIKPDGIVEGVMELDTHSNGNSQHVDHKKWYECLLANRQVSVLALCFLMKLG